MTRSRGPGCFMSGEQPVEDGGYTEAAFMSGEQPSEGGGYTEVQAGPPAHAPAPPIPAVRTLHNPFFVTGLVGGDEQTPSSVPSSVPWPSQPTAAEDTASSQCPLLSFYPEPTDGTDSMLPDA